MGKHALLSASSSERWMNCPPSARLCAKYADSTSSYAAEGTEAHTLGEFYIRHALGIKAKNPIPTLQYYNEEMEYCATIYAEYVLELLEKARSECADPVLHLEQRLDFSNYVPEGFGTGDAVIVSDGTLHVVDYKHGSGVLVEAEANSQLMLYGLGALRMFDGIYSIEKVAMTVFQPRRDNIATYELTPADLYQWADEVLKPAADMAFAGKGKFKCGSWCQFCRAKANCRARAEENMKLAAYDFEEPPLLADDEIAVILGKVDELVSWANDIKNYALSEALKGTEFDGWKVVAGRSNRKYSDENAVAEAVTATGADPYEHKLMGITALEKLLGKKKFEELLGGLIHKPAGKPVLVPTTDKREQLHITSAADDFADLEN